MRFVSLFSGVGGFDLGLERAGWECVAQVEWDAHCQEVLARHWPDVPRSGDVSTVHGGDLPAADVVAFGSPCQDLSVAGQRAGLADGSRSSLFFEAVRIIKEMRDATSNALPRFIIWENVAGSLSSSDGRDFARVLDELAELGAVDISWRVLDARWFGVPQRRRRVFVVADLAGECAGAIHAESSGMSWAATSSRSARQGATRSTPTGHRTNGSTTLARWNRVWSFDSAWGGQSSAYVDLAPPVKVGTALGIASPPAVALVATTTDIVCSLCFDAGYVCTDPEHVNCDATSVSCPECDRRNLLGVDASTAPGPVVIDYELRKLSPIECERLMGWPDDHTRWRVDGTEVSDSTRYRMCGNGVVSPVAEWIGQRLNDALVAEEPF